MPHLHDLITTKAQELFPELQRLRRDFHRHPELSNQEERTGRLAAEYLTGLGLEVQTNVAGHGVVADLVCPRPGPTLAWRADMDALPIQEPSGQTLVLPKPRSHARLRPRFSPGHRPGRRQTAYRTPGNPGRPYPLYSPTRRRRSACRARWAAPNSWSSSASWLR